MAKGTVIWFSSEKGFGFIKPEEGSRDVFCHYTSIQRAGKGPRNLEKDDEVFFDVVEGERGPQAQNVRKA